MMQAFTCINSKLFTLPKPPLLFLLFITLRSNYYYEIICIVPMYSSSFSNVTIVKSRLLRFVYVTALGFSSFGELAGLCGVPSLLSLLSNLLFHDEAFLYQFLYSWSTLFELSSPLSLVDASTWHHHVSEESCSVEQHFRCLK